MAKTIQLNGHSVTVKGLVSAYDTVPARSVVNKLFRVIEAQGNEQQKDTAEETAYFVAWFGNVVAATTDAGGLIDLPAMSDKPDVLLDRFDRFMRLPAGVITAWVEAIDQESEAPNDPDLLPPSEVDPNA